MGVKCFENDLEYGQVGELKFVEYVQSKNSSVFCETNIIKDKDKRSKLTPEELEQLRGWDVRTIDAFGRISYFEVKRDQKSKYTGNIAIEYRCVEHTKSDYFIYILDEDCKEMYLIPTQNIKYMLSDNVSGFSCMGGDGKRSYMKVIKKELVMSFAKKLD